MDKRVSYRLTGSIFLIALAVILLPIVLDGDASERLIEQAKIPATPDFDVALISMSNDIKTSETQKLDTSPLSESKLATLKKNTTPLQSESAKNDAEKHVENEEVKSVTASSNQPKEQIVVSKPSPKVDNSASPKADNNAKPLFNKSAYLVQLGTFSSETNANKLVAKVKKAGYLANVKTTDQGLHRVIVGPYLEKDVAAKERDKLKKAFKLDGILIKY